MSLSDFDIAVCGGGVAGAASAALLAASGHRVALIDVRRPDWQMPADDFDARVVAISPGSARILTASGAWLKHPASRRAEYRQMQVLSGSGRITFDAQSHGLDQLGWITEVPALQQAQWLALAERGNVRILAPASVERLDRRRDRWRLGLDSGQHLDCALVVAADGARSRLRHLAGIKVDEWHYNQHALVTHLRCRRPNEGVAWQRFTENGPLALLPLPDGRSSIVWSQPRERVQQLLALPTEDFINELNQHQDSPFGEVNQVGPRHAFKLVRRQARRLVGNGLVLLGDAARNVHPLAGQGLNLGLADAAALAEVLEDWQVEQDPQPRLERYLRWRQGSGSLIGGGIHLINELAHAPALLGPGLLGLGFGLAARLWPARELFVRRACGLDSDSPRLARAPDPDFR